MQSSTQNPLVFGAIVLVHCAVAFGLFNMSPREVADTRDKPLTVRFVTVLQQKSEAQPVEVKAIAPNITVPIPEMPLFDMPVAQGSERAITIPVRATSPVATEERSNAPKLISAVEYLREPVPRYPSQSRKLREQGLVMLRVLIDERGVASSIEIENSSGYSRLDHAAREAVARAAFRPYVEDGAPRRALVLIPIEFSLGRNSA